MGRVIARATAYLGAGALVVGGIVAVITTVVLRVHDIDGAGPITAASAQQRDHEPAGDDERHERHPYPRLPRISTARRCA